MAQNLTHSASSAELKEDISPESFARLDFLGTDWAKKLEKQWVAAIFHGYYGECFFDFLGILQFAALITINICPFLQAE